MLRRILAVSALTALFVPVLASGADFSLTSQNTKITFVGTKPGGKHVGGFKTVSGTAAVSDKDLTSLKINLDIDTSSLYTDNPMLTNHLKSPDFFGVKSNPKAKFVSTKVASTGSGYDITGDLTLLGQTKSITFPAAVALSSNGLALETAFTIDRTQWGMTFGKGKVDDNVKLTVNVKATN
jgi:polyisoprenoid-binding protein YceI